MDYSLNEISLYQVLIYLFIGVLSAMVTYIITYYILPLLSLRKSTQMHGWSRVQIVFWILYAGLLFVILFRMNMLVTVAMSVVVFGAGWNYWRNLFAGLVIKLNSQLSIGDAIDLEFAKGELKSIGFSQSELVNESGEVIVVPNNRLRSAILRHLNKESNVQMHAFYVAGSGEWTQDAIRNLALQCPYISANQKLEVERLDNGELVIRAAVIDNIFVDNVNHYFKEIAH